MSTKKTQKQKFESPAVVARTADGTLQITFSIPYDVVQKVREIQLSKALASLEVPGFRKGKAPKGVAENQIDKQKLYELTLQYLLPEYYTKALVENKLRPVLQPRFELISVEEDKDWSIRAVTCDLPEIKLGDYKKIVSGLKVADIWTPSRSSDSGQAGQAKGMTREEKEQGIIKALLEEAQVSLPALLIEEEVNHKLAQLLDQVQKIGLSVEQYLASTGKTIDQVKADFAKQSEDSIKLVLILNKVVEDEKLQVKDEEIEEAIQVSSASADEKTRQAMSSPEQKSLIRAVLSRRKALDSLVNLV